MSDDLQISIPANRPEDFLAEQPIKDYVVSFPISPPIDETEMSSRNDDTASLAPPQKEDVCLVPQLNNVADTKSLPKENDSPVIPPKEYATQESPPKEDVTPAPPQMNGTDHTASRSSLPSNKNIALKKPKVKSEFSKANRVFSKANSVFSKANSANSSRVNSSRVNSSRVNTSRVNSSRVNSSRVNSSRVNSNEATNSNGASGLIKKEIKQETIDLGNDTYYYDDIDKQIPFQAEQIESKVGFDRGLEPDHIVGATEVDGKLMFLIAWKNSNVADLLESTVVYEKCPQIAIQFYEARLRYCPCD